MSLPAAPVSRAAHFIDISFFVRRVPSKAMPVTGSGNNRKKGVCDIAVWSERCGHTGGLLFGDAPYMGKKEKAIFGTTPMQTGIG